MATSSSFKSPVFSKSLDDPVVISGLGLVTGFGLDDSWPALLAGKSAARWLDVEYPHGDRISPTTHIGMFAGSEFRFDRNQGGTLSQTRFSHMAQLVVSRAMLEAELTGVDPHRIGTVFGTSKGDMHAFELAARVQSGQLTKAESCAFERKRESDPAFFEQLFWDAFQPNHAARQVRFEHGGPSLCPVAACATGLVSVIRGSQLIQDAHCDVVIAGAVDSSITRMLLASYHRLGVLAKNFDDPALAGRPFDRRRNGFLVGDGAAAFVLERAGHAAARQAPPAYAEFLAGGYVGDAAGLTRLDPAAESVSFVIQDVLRRGGVTRHAVDYINLHGTGTLMNDACEALAVSREFPNQEASLICSGQKGAIGHTMGAAGAVETAITLLAMRNGIVPPTTNLEQSDSACRFELAGDTSVRHPIKHALKLSLGFGGHVAAALFRARQPANRSAKSPSSLRTD